VSRDDAQLHWWRSAQAVDQQRHAITAPQATVRDDGTYHGLDQRRGRPHLRPLHALLAVDAQAQFDLVIAEREAGFARRRHNARAEGDAHRSEPRRRIPRDRRDVGKTAPALRRRAGDLVNQHRAGDAATPLGLHHAAQRDVIRNDNDLARHALTHGELGGECEIQTVASVVLDDQ
jgi:hypothetical protein